MACPSSGLAKRATGFVGDPLELSRKASESEKTHYIVFCGVHFMAESAAILAQPHQIVQIPEIEAGCWVADMANPLLWSRFGRSCLLFWGLNS